MNECEFYILGLNKKIANEMKNVETRMENEIKIWLIERRALK